MSRLKFMTACRLKVWVYVRRDTTGRETETGTGGKITFTLHCLTSVCKSHLRNKCVVTIKQAFLFTVFIAFMYLSIGGFQ